MKDPHFILGVPVHPLSFWESQEKLLEACVRGKQLFCITPNPEICLHAQKDAKYLNILQSAGLAVPDGFGLLWAGRFLKGHNTFWKLAWTLLTPWLTKKYSPFPERITGTDMMLAFCKEHPERRVFLLGASQEVNEKLSRLLKEKYGTRVAGNFSGTPDEKSASAIRSRIETCEAEVLFVAFGAPKQEQWIADNLPKLKNVQVAMGVGGAFDFLAGERKRAPGWMRNVGLEWLYRLLIEPKRVKRIINATIVFPWKVWKEPLQ
ncbi:MAG: WecB/TagA/CpsF family glycosyltransferase [bacterium]|nr:WecB/TagA/CpsF family glycosyltransferase [bacterium]